MTVEARPTGLDARVVAGVFLLVLSLGGMLVTSELALLALAPLGLFLVALSLKAMDGRSWLLLASWILVLAVGLSALRSLTADYGPDPSPKDDELHQLGWYVLGSGVLLAAALTFARRKPLVVVVGVLVLSGVALGVSESLVGDIRDRSNCACFYG